MLRNVSGKDTQELGSCLWEENWHLGRGGAVNLPLPTPIQNGIFPHMRALPYNLKTSKDMNVNCTHMHMLSDHCQN